MNIDKKIIADSITHYGAEMQTTVCMEELSELIQAISKEKRGQSDKSHLTEEVADVIISIEILKQIYSIDDTDIQSWIDLKQKRISNKIK